MDFKGAINSIGDTLAFLTAVFWRPSFIKEEDWQDSPPPQQRSPDCQSQRVEEWRQQVWGRSTVLHRAYRMTTVN